MKNLDNKTKDKFQKITVLSMVAVLILSVVIMELNMSMLYIAGLSLSVAILGAICHLKYDRSKYLWILWIGITIIWLLNYLKITL